MRGRAEAYLWLLFSAGGVLAALLLPVFLLLFGVLMPLGLVGWPSGAHLAALLGPAWVRVALTGAVLLCLFHAAHRVRHTAEELFGLARFDLPIAVLCYGSALGGTFGAAWLLW